MQKANLVSKALGTKLTKNKCLVKIEMKRNGSDICDLWYLITFEIILKFSFRLERKSYKKQKIN